MKHIKSNLLDLTYLTKGRGEIGAICFHGFGRSAEDFMAVKFPEGLKIVSVNLPFHGDTNFISKSAKKTLTKSHLLELVLSIIEAEQIKSVYLIGYSLGGKAVLSLSESPELKILGVQLFAPDGFKANPWYWFASQTKIGQALNRISIENPVVFRSFLRICELFKLASRRQISFARKQMDSQKKRKQVFDIWKGHRKLNPNFGNIEKQMKNQGFRVTIVLGQFDKIIPQRSIKNWSLNKTSVQLIIESCGHQIPHETLSKHIISIAPKRK